jgi:hypothetical protein
MRPMLQPSELAILKREQFGRRRLLKLGMSLAGAASMSSLLVACEVDDAGKPARTSADDEVVAEGDDEDVAATEPEDEVEDDAQVVEVDDMVIELPDGFEPFELSELDMETLQGDIPDATLET